MQAEDANNPPIDILATDAKTIADRPQVHRCLREAGKVVRIDAPGGGPAWVVTDEALARQVLTDDRFAKDPGLAPSHWHGRDPSLEPPVAVARSVTTMDGAEHRRMRHVQAPAFTRRRLLAGRGRLVDLAHVLLDRLAAESARTGQPSDLVAGFGARYPLLVICDLLGIPTADIDQAVRANRAMTHGEPDQAYAALAQLQTVVRSALASADDDPDQNLATMLASRAKVEFGELDENELHYMITGLVFAAQITTETFLSYLLAYRIGCQDGLGPAAKKPVGADQPDDAGGDASVDEQIPEEQERFLAEVLRMHPPAPFTLWRFTTNEVELDGTALPSGAPVLVDIEGISTDPKRHRNGDEFCPDRPRLDELTFGAGPHICMGVQLARLEGQVVLEVLANDFPDARLAVPFDELPRDNSANQSRRLAALPVWLRPRPDQMNS